MESEPVGSARQPMAMCVTISFETVELMHGASSLVSPVWMPNGREEIPAGEANEKCGARNTG